MTSIYRKTNTERERTSGTVNLRTWLRQFMTAREVNSALVTLNREPYVKHYFPTLTYGLDVSVEITPASGQFEMGKLWW